MALYGARDTALAQVPTSGVMQIVSEQIDSGDGGETGAQVRIQYDPGNGDPVDQRNHEDFALQQTPPGWVIVVPSWATKNVAKWLANPTTDPGLANE